MKKCPNCQKTYEDNMKFCQTDGTRLVVVADETAADDPYKTMVASDIKLPVEEPKAETPEPDPAPEPEAAPVEASVSEPAPEPDPLEIPEQPVPAATEPEPAVEEEPPLDPMKTLVVSGSDTASNLKIPDLPAESEKSGDEPAPEIPQFSEPDIQPPDFSEAESTSPESPVEEEVQETTEEPERVSAPLEESSSSIPIPSPFDESMPPGMAPPETPPFHQSDEPDAKVEEESSAAPPASPFDETPSSPFDEPQPEPAPSGELASEPDPFSDNQMSDVPKVETSVIDDPFANNQAESSLAATSGSEISSGGDAEGENKTLAFVSLGLGIASFLCGIGPLGGLGAIITGYMAKKNIKNDPETYGGGTLATVGMILGVLAIIVTVAVTLLWIVLLVSNT